MEWLRAVDLDLFQVVNGYAGHRLLDIAVINLSQNTLLRAAILVAPYAFFWFRRPDLRDRARLIGGLAGACLAVVVARALAHLLPFELRPMFDPASGYRPVALPFKPDLEDWSAFPSDTTALCAAVTLGLYPVHRLCSILCLCASFILFSVSRVYLGIHYPADIAAGLAIAVISAVVAQQPVFQRLYAAVVAGERGWQPWFYAAMFLSLSELAQMFDGARALMRLARFIS